MATKDFGYRSWADAWGGVPPGHLLHFDYELLGRYDPAREDIPGHIPEPRHLDPVWDGFVGDLEDPGGGGVAAAEGGEDEDTSVNLVGTNSDSVCFPGRERGWCHLLSVAIKVCLVVAIEVWCLQGLYSTLRAALFP